MNALLDSDLKLILNAQFPQLPASLLNDMVRFNSRLASEAGVIWGHVGSPWEMNLRDITRWCEATIEAVGESAIGNGQHFNPGDSVELVYVNRMRTTEDRQKVFGPNSIKIARYTARHERDNERISNHKIVSTETMPCRDICEIVTSYRLMLRL